MAFQLCITQFIFAGVIKSILLNNILFENESIRQIQLNFTVHDPITDFYSNPICWRWVFFNGISLASFLPDTQCVAFIDHLLFHASIYFFCDSVFVAIRNETTVSINENYEYSIKIEQKEFCVIVQALGKLFKPFICMLSIE